MSEIKKLIERLCPDGVEYKRLGDITEILRGRRLTKKELTDNAEYPVYHGGIEPIGYYSHHNRPANTVMIINVGASAGTVGYCNKPFWSSDGCYCIDKSELLSDRYLYHVLSKNQLAFPVWSVEKCHLHPYALHTHLEQPRGICSVKKIIWSSLRCAKSQNGSGAFFYNRAICCKNYPVSSHHK